MRCAAAPRQVGVLLPSTVVVLHEYNAVKGGVKMHPPFT
jgi:hypothetical protein